MARRKKNEPQMMSADTYRLQQRAGEVLISWLRNSYAKEYDFSNDGDEDINLRNAQAQGYNEVRAELFERVADLILEKCEDPETDDDYDDDECDCD